MNIREDIQQLKTDARTLRKFGLLVGGVFAAFGVLFLLRHKGHYPYFLWPGAGLMVLGAVLPRMLKWVYLAWMGLAIVIGFCMAHAILVLLFYLVITPVGWAARLVGRDFLQRELDPSRASYWLPRERRERTPSEYEKQY